MPGPGTFLIGNEERREVAEVMETGYLSRYGNEDDPRFKQKVVTLEREFAKKIGTRYAVATETRTGTSASPTWPACRSITVARAKSFANRHLMARAANRSLVLRFRRIGVSPPWPTWIPPLIGSS